MKAGTAGQALRRTGAGIRQSAKTGIARRPLDTAIRSVLPLGGPGVGRSRWFARRGAPG